MIIGLYADHAGFSLKEELYSTFKDTHALKDFGTHNLESVHYPNFAHQAAKDLKNQLIDRAILICGTGIGMAIAANRFSWVRAFVAHTQEETQLARAHNNANIMCLSGRFPPDFKTLFKTFIEAPFEGERHQLRIDMFS